MNGRQSTFGFAGTSGMGRPSGIRPPTSYGQQNRPKLQSTSSEPSIPSTASSRKTNNNHNFLFNFPGSGGSRGSRLSNQAPGGANGGRQSVFGNLRANPFASARKSVTAKIGPLFGLTPTQSNRASYQPNTCSSAQSSRRSSVGGNRHIKDSRPLSETSYQRQCVTKLVSFLTENGYNNAIPKNFATRPTVSEVSKIFEFLFMCCGLKSKVLPMEIEVPKAMALLEYPFPVKKSDLVSFASGRALGSVLGMLEWLVDSLTYSNSMDPIRTFYPNFEGEIDIKYELIRICLNTTEEDSEEQVDGLLNDLIVKTYGTEDDFEQMADEQEGLDQELRRLDEEIQQMRELPQQIQSYETDIKNYDNYKQEMNAHYNQNQEVFDSLEKDLSEKIDSKKKLEDEKRQIAGLVEGQEFGLEEVVLARERKQQLEEEIKQEYAIIDDIKRGIRATRLECSKYEDIIKKMDSDLDSFIAVMTDLLDSPVMSNYSSSLRQLLSSPEWTEIVSSLRCIKAGETHGSYGTNINELEKLFSHKVHELKLAIVQQLSSIQGCLTLTEQQKHNELLLHIQEKEKQLKLNETIIAKQMTQIESMRKEQVSQTALLQSECDRTRQLLNEVDGNTKRSHKEEKQILLDLRKQVEEKEALYGCEQKELVKEFETNVNNHKNGLKEFSLNLDSILTKEQTKSVDLKRFINKIDSSVASSKERKTREKREKRSQKENNK